MRHSGVEAALFISYIMEVSFRWFVSFFLVFFGWSRTKFSGMEKQETMFVLKNEDLYLQEIHVNGPRTALL